MGKENQVTRIYDHAHDQIQKKEWNTITQFIRRDVPSILGLCKDFSQMLVVSVKYYKYNNVTSSTNFP